MQNNTIITSRDDPDHYIHSPNAWHFDDPSPRDYEKIVKKYFGNHVKKFTVFYNDIAVCGRV